MTVTDPPSLNSHVRLVPESEPPDDDPDDVSGALERKQSDKVVYLPIATSLDATPQRVLEGALEADLDSVIVIGYTKGDPKLRAAKDEYFASSIAAGDTCVWLLNRYIHKLIAMADEEWDGEDGELPLPPNAS